MIDERINNSLRELEEQLRNVESARMQVERTVNSFDGIKSTIGNYVQSLKSIGTKLSEVVTLIKSDYQTKVAEFEKDRTTIVNNTNEVIGKVNSKVDEITELVSSNVNSIQRRLLYSLILNAVSLIAIAVLLFR